MGPSFRSKLIVSVHCMKSDAGRSVVQYDLHTCGLKSVGFLEPSDVKYFRPHDVLDSVRDWFMRSRGWSRNPQGLLRAHT